MRRHRRSMAALGLGLVLGIAPAGSAQVFAPPATPGATDLNGMIHQLEERVRHLGEDVASDMGQSPDGRHLLEDTRAVADAVARMHGALHDFPDPRQVQAAYGNVDASWHHLRSVIGQRPVSPAVERAARRVDEVDGQIHQALGMSVAPPAAGAPGLAGVPPVQTNIAMRPAFGAAPPPAAVIGVADQLVAQVDTFLRGFAPTADAVPEGRQFLQDAQTLRAIAADLQQLARAGAPPERLAQQTQLATQQWQVLAGRIQRVAQGRTGPNIQAAMRIGDIAAQLGPALGGGYGPAPGPVPGYPGAAFPGVPQGPPPGHDHHDHDH